MFGNAAASLTRRRNTREVEALQVRMRRQVSGSEIELHRIARLRDGWAGRGQAQVFEDLLDRGALGQKGEHRHAAAAAFAAQDIDAEDPLESSAQGIRSAPSRRQEVSPWRTQPARVHPRPAARLVREMARPACARRHWARTHRGSEPSGGEAVGSASLACGGTLSGRGAAQCARRRSGA